MATENQPEPARRGESRVRIRSDPNDGFVMLDTPLDDDWLASYRFEPSEQGGVVLAEIRVVPRQATATDARKVTKYLAPPPRAERPKPPQSDLTVRGLRRLRPGDARDVVEQELLAMAAQRGEDFVAEWHGFERAALEAPRRPGRRGHDDRFLAHVASVYAVAIAAGSRRPIADAAERLREAGQHYSRPRIRDLVFQARERGLLSAAAAPGRAGGELTDAAKEILAEGES
jgi:hypothetical protein